MRYIAILVGLLVILLGMLAMLTGHQMLFPMGGGQQNSGNIVSTPQVVAPEPPKVVQPAVNPPKVDEPISCARWDGPAGSEGDVVVMNGKSQKCQRGAFGKGNWVPVP